MTIASFPLIEDFARAVALWCQSHPGEERRSAKERADTAKQALVDALSSQSLSLSEARADLTASRKLVERRETERDREKERADGNWDAYRDMIRERDELRAEIERLREALRPFAKAAEDCGVEDDLRIGVVKPADVIWESAVAVSITYAHVESARSALENSKAGLADATPNQTDPSLSSLRKGPEVELRRAICNIVDAVEISISLEFHPLIRKRLAEAKLLIDRPALVSGSREDGE